LRLSMRKAIRAIIFILPFLLCGAISREILLPADTIIFLPDSTIIPESLKVNCYRNDAINLEYKVLDKITGKISINPAPDCDSILIRYHAVKLKPIEKTNSVSATSIEFEPPGHRTFKSESKLEFNYSGSLIRSVTLSTYEGVRSESGLNFELDGQIGEQGGIKAVVADEDLPIQPEGTTEELQELDKLLITAYSPHYSVTFGSFELEDDEPFYLKYSRRVEGIVGAVSYPEISGKIAIAGSGGKYITNSFYGQEGVNGPYELSGENGEKGIVVVAGSEKVFLDGAQMRRGENNDYTIDYTNGTITFTPRHIITKDSRITVEFQYNDEAYFKRFVSSSLSLNVAKNLRIGFAYLEESDEPSSPLFGELTETEKSALAKAGTNPDSARIPTFSRSNTGDYNLQPDSLGDSIFVYAGQDSGSYEVTFNDVGTSHGDYTLTNNIYVYVGNGKGRYSPYRYIPLPVLNRYFGFSAKYKPGNRFALGFELVRRSFDLNRLSNRGDEGSSGIGYILEGTIGKFGGFYSSFTLEKREPKFTPPSKTGELEFTRGWGTDEYGGFEREESKLGFEQAGTFKCELSAGRVKKEGLNSNRFTGKIAFERFSIHTGGEFDFTDRHSLTRLKWLKTSSFFNWKIARLVTPIFTYAGERKRENKTGNNFDEFTPGIEIEISSDLNISLFTSLRNEKMLDTLTNSFLPSFRAKSYTSTLKWKRGDFNNELVLSRRISNYIKPFGTGETKTDLLQSDLSYNNINKRVFLRAFYRLSSTLQSKIEKYFERVQTGTGNWRYDPQRGEYIEQPGGDYEQKERIIQLGMPASNLRMGTSGTINPGNLIPIEFLKKTVLNHFLSAERLIPLSSPLSRYYISPINFFKSSYLIMGRISARSGIIYQVSNDSRINLDWQLDSYLDRRGANEERHRDETYSLESNFRLLAGFSHLTYLERKNILEYAQAINYGNLKLTKYKIETGIDWNAITNTNIGVMLKFSRDLERMRYNTDVDRFAVQTKLSVPLMDGLVRISCEGSIVSGKDKNLFLPAQMAEGEQMGYNALWNVAYEREFGEKLGFAVRYDGRTGKKQKLNQSLRIEGQLYF